METVEFTGYRVDALTDFALDFLRTRTGEKPFGLFLSYIEPHYQNDHHRYEGPEGSQERFSNFTPPGDLAALEGDWEKEFPDYLGCCASLDQSVGRLRAELERLGLADNTLVIYTSDHGSHFRTRNKHLETGNYNDYKGRSGVGQPDRLSAHHSRSRRGAAAGSVCGAARLIRHMRQISETVPEICPVRDVIA